MSNISVYGFCRGMQMITNYFGAELARVGNYVATWHRINGSSPWDVATVNSFHNIAVKAATEELLIMTRSEDDSIEIYSGQR